MAATYLHMQLNNAASSEHALPFRNRVNEDLKEILAINGKNSFATLPGWDISASSGSGIPPAPQPASRSWAATCGNAIPRVRVKGGGVGHLRVGSARRRDSPQITPMRCTLLKSAISVSRKGTSVGTVRVDRVVIVYPRLRADRIVIVLDLAQVVVKSSIAISLWAIRRRGKYT